MEKGIIKIIENLKKFSRYKKGCIDFTFDLNFWSIFPAINLNFHGGFTLEFEWLFFAVYISKPL